MNAKDAIRWIMDMGHNVLTRYVSDMNDADLMIRPSKGSNHLAWQLGHLISSEYQLVNGVCPGISPELPSGFKERHAKDATSVDDPSKFLTKQEYLDLFAKQRQATKAALEQVPDADLDKPGPESVKRMCKTVGAVFCLAAEHPMMHAGQFAIVRRILGKPVLI